MGIFGKILNKNQSYKTIGSLISGFFFSSCSPSEIVVVTTTSIPKNWYAKYNKYILTNTKNGGNTRTNTRPEKLEWNTDLPGCHLMKWRILRFSVQNYITQKNYHRILQTGKNKAGMGDPGSYDGFKFFRSCFYKRRDFRFLFDQNWR